MSAVDFSGLPDVRQVVAIEGSALTAADLAGRFANEPVLLKGAAKASATLDWSNVLEAMATTICTVSTHVDFGERSHRFTSDVELGDFFAALDRLERVYLSEFYLFERAPELVAPLTRDLPPPLRDDLLDLLPPRSAFLRSVTRTNVYLGASGSRTNLHLDGLSMTTWNMCLRGTKRWLLFSCQGTGGEPGGPGFAAFRALSPGTEARTFLTPAKIEAYRRAFPSQVPAFRVVDVSEGDVLYVPSCWAHQVENIGTSLAISRYFVGPHNLAPFLRASRPVFGVVAPAVLRLLLGGERRRSLLRRRLVKRALASRPLSGAIGASLRAGGTLARGHHWFTPPRAAD